MIYKYWPLKIKDGLRIPRLYSRVIISSLDNVILETLGLPILVIQVTHPSDAFRYMTSRDHILLGGGAILVTKVHLVCAAQALDDGGWFD